MIFQMSEDELEAFVKLVDDNGEISKNDIIIQVKNIYMWHRLAGNIIQSSPGSVLKVSQFDTKKNVFVLRRNNQVSGKGT